MTWELGGAAPCGDLEHIASPLCASVTPAVKWEATSICLMGLLRG